MKQNVVVVGSAEPSCPHAEVVEVGVEVAVVVVSAELICSHADVVEVGVEVV